MLFLALLACNKPVAPEAAVPAQPPREAPTPAPADPMAPRPFPADALRAAMPTGTRLRFRIEPAGQPAVEERWEVMAATEADCTIRSVTHDATTGAVIEGPVTATTTWAELVAHAAFPVALTRIEDASVTVPAGTFETKRYTVEDLDGTVRVFDFAPSLPGPPVQVSATKDGVPRMSMTLLERS